MHLVWQYFKFICFIRFHFYAWNFPFCMLSFNSWICYRIKYTEILYCSCFTLACRLQNNTIFFFVVICVCLCYIFAKHFVISNTKCLIHSFGWKSIFFIEINHFLLKWLNITMTRNEIILFYFCFVCFFFFFFANWSKNK